MIKRDPPSGRIWIIGIILALIIVIAVNIFMITMAIQSGHGEIEDHPYERSLTHQSVIDRRDFIQKQGWKFDIALKKVASTQTTFTASVYPKDVDLSSYPLHAEIRRPADATYDRSCNLNQDSPTSFSCQLTSLPTGLYYVTLALGSEGLVEAQVMLR